jgi:hypothetical protein
MTNYLNVEKQKAKSEASQHVLKERPVPADVKKSLRSNEERLKQLAAEEKARRTAGGSGGDLATRLAALPDVELPRAAKPNTKSAIADSHADSRAADAAGEAERYDEASARFRAAAMSQPIVNLRRMCDEMGLSSQGNRLTLVESLVAHSQQHHARRMQSERPPSSASTTMSTTSSRRPAVAESGRPATGLSVASLSLEPQRSTADEELAPPSTAQSVQSFVAASSFGGARRGQVFKNDARGVGYYRDR